MGAKFILFAGTIDVISMSFAIRGHNCRIVPLFFLEKELKMVKVCAQKKRGLHSRVNDSLCMSKPTMRMNRKANAHDY